MSQVASVFLKNRAGFPFDPCLGVYIALWGWKHFTGSLQYDSAMQGQFMVITVEEQSHLALQALTGAAGVRKNESARLFFGLRSTVCVCQPFPSNSFSAVKTVIHYLEAALMRRLNAHITI